MPILSMNCEHDLYRCINICKTKYMSQIAYLKHYFLASLVYWWGFVDHLDPHHMLGSSR